MAPYLLVHDARLFHEQIRPTLAAARRTRSFQPCRPLAATLAPAALAFRERYCIEGAVPFTCQLAVSNFPFDRDLWRYLVGEWLLVAAVEIPELQASPASLACLTGSLLPETEPDRRGHPVAQLYEGRHALVFGGGMYRPGQAGWNDLDDIRRLAQWLEQVEPDRWHARALASLPGMDDADEREEELAFVRDWFPPLRELYVRSRELDRIIVCEQPGG